MNNYQSSLLEKIEDKHALIGIIGLGYVGLPLFIRYAEEGYKVVGIDVDQSKIDSLNEQRSYISHISNESLVKVRDNYKVTTDFSVARELDALILCVPTPLDKYREPDLTYVLKTMESLTPFLRKGQVLSLESTTYPGTTEEELQPRIENTGLSVGEDFFLVYSPEREDPGNRHFETSTIPKVCGGVSSACLCIGQAMYQTVIKNIVPVSSTKVAEMTKLLENIHRAVNIGLVNEMKLVADEMGIDIYEVIDAASTKPFGFVPYYPGPGIGGHCIPIDPFYLTWKAREYGLHTRFIELAGEINGSMPNRVVNKVIGALNNHGKALKGAQVLVLGVAYKKDVDDVRESPALFIIEELQELGAVVNYHDPHVAEIPRMRAHNIELKSQDLTPEGLQAADVVVLITSHSAFDYQAIYEQASLIVDTRGVFRTFDHSKIVQA
jgi:UDP-N-acetyl-D-glucosamine dehydrogenase